MTSLVLPSLRSRLSRHAPIGLTVTLSILIFGLTLAFPQDATAQTQTGTTLKITNTTTSSVQVMITLGSSSGVSSVNQLPTSWGVVASPPHQTSQGIFTLSDNSSVSFNSGTKSFSGNIAFGPTFTARGCGSSTANACFPNATNLAEFTLNQPGETVDISNVNGVNAQFSVVFTGQTAKNPWNNGAGGNGNTTSIPFQPITLAGSGVFGWQATTCTGNSNPPNPQPNCPKPVSAPSKSVVQSVAQCNIQRAGNAPTGGTVEILFAGYVQGSAPASNCVSP